MRVVSTPHCWSSPGSPGARDVSEGQGQPRTCKVRGSWAQLRDQKPSGSRFAAVLRGCEVSIFGMMIGSCKGRQSCHISPLPRSGETCRGLLVLGKPSILPRREVHPQTATPTGEPRVCSSRHEDPALNSWTRTWGCSRMRPAVKLKPRRPRHHNGKVDSEFRPLLYF